MWCYYAYLLYCTQHVCDNEKDLNPRGRGGGNYPPPAADVGRGVGRRLFHLALLVGWRNHAGCPPWLDEEAKRFLSRTSLAAFQGFVLRELSSTRFEAFVNRAALSKGAAELGLRRLNCTNLAAHCPGWSTMTGRVVSASVSSIEYSRSGGWGVQQATWKRAPNGE